MNIADYYINGLPEIGPWRDMHVRIEGPAAEYLQKAFCIPGTRKPDSISVEKNVSLWIKIPWHIFLT